MMPLDAVAHRTPLRPATIVVAVAVAGSVVALVVGGGAARADGSAAVAWALPLLRLVSESAAVVTIGCLIGALVYSKRGTAHRYARVAALAALVWSMTAAAMVPHVAADLSGRAVNPDMLVNTALSVPQGRAQFLAALAGLTIFTVVWLTRRAGALATCSAVMVGGIVPAAFAGHAASSLDHNTATTSMALHILFASTWAGGLIALLLHARWDPSAPSTHRRRLPARPSVVIAHTTNQSVQTAVTVS